MKTFKRALSLVLAVVMLASVMLVGVSAEEAKTVPHVTVDLTPGAETSNEITVNGVKREVTANTSKVSVTTKQTAGELTSPQSALKFDRNSSADQTAQRKVRDLYTDNGHFSDPDSFTVTGAPEGYPFQYVGTGDYGGHYVSHIRVIYERDGNGNAKKDANGNYIIKELQHSNGTPLTINLEPTTSLTGPYDQTTGTRPLQFLLKDANGNTVYAYCIDVQTGTDVKEWYAVANLEDNDYYASAEAEDHVRGIVFNGYWGTAEGTGSLASLKAALKAALAAGRVDTTYDVNFRNRTKIDSKTARDEDGNVILADDQYASENYIYTKLNKSVTLTNDVIDGLTEGEALDAMQCAIWSWANGSNATLDGTDRMIVGDMYYASSAMGDSRNGVNDFEGAARTKALYQYLMQQTASETTTIINDKTFAEDMTLTIGDQIGGSAYEASLKFSMPVALSEKDNLKVVLTYVDADGKTQTIEKALTGSNAMVAENGYYTIDGLQLNKNNPFQFTLNIAGEQYVTKNAYIYTAAVGVSGAQTMVGMAEGTISVDITKSIESTFTVEDSLIPVTPPEHEVVTPEPTADKTDKLIDRPSNRFEVEVAVPGVDGDKRHDEVILMVDGSYSMDDEWPAMKEAINTIGKTVLNGSGNTQLTLMAFGMADNEVLVHVKDADELAAALGELPGTLLYGRSSTNCEAGFTGVAEYIANHDASLNEVNVIFISDGNLNTDETPRDFYFNWKNWATKYGALTVAQIAFEQTVLYGTNLPKAFTTVFGDRFAGATNDEILARAFGGEVTNDEFLAFADEIWADVYAYSGLVPGIKYPVSDAERAFVKYDKEKGTYIQNAFYYTTYKSSYVTYGDRWTRTPAAAEVLAAMDEVAALYMVDYDSKSSWMELTNEKATFVQSNGIAGLCEALKGALTDLAKTPFNDVYVTDYMSKWVNLDATTLKIVDNSTGAVIWTAKDGWKITENRPTAKEPPVVVELVDPADYAAGGDDVIGNKSGDIYKLTWYVKDGAMLRSDTYSLKYEVTVDTAEEGFVYETQLPANGDTTMHYKDEEGKDQEKEIEVPPVDALATDLKLKKVDQNGNALTGAEFELFKVEGEAKTSVGTFAVDAKGEVTVTGLGTGSYELVETKAPEGFLTLDAPIEITVDDALNVSIKETNFVSMNANGEVVVVNHPPHAAVVLTIDMSGTMYRNKMNSKRYVDVAKAKALEFVEQYAATAVNGGKRLVSVVCFDTDAKVQQNWIDVSTASGLTAAKKAINNIKVADNGSASSNQVCTNFDGGIILSRNLLKEAAVKDVDKKFAIVLSDGAPTVTVNSDTNTVGTIKSSFWGNQLDASGKKYQNKHCGGGWTHPAEVESTLKYLATGDNNLADQTCSYLVDGERREGIFIVGVGGLMNFKLFNDAVYGTSNGTRTSDVKKKPAAFNNVEALQGYTQAQIMAMTTGEWMAVLANAAGGTYESATNTTALQNEFTNILNFIKDTTTPVA